MTKIRLSEWANIAEVVGAGAVVISLLYVGAQVRANTDEVRAGNRQQLVSRSAEATRGLATSPEIAAILAKVSEGDSLNPAESIQYGYVIRSLLYDIQEAYLLYREGRLEEEYWRTRAAIAEAYMASAAARDVYDRDKSIGALHSAFVQWLDQALVRP